MIPYKNILTPDLKERRAEIERVRDGLKIVAHEGVLLSESAEVGLCRARLFLKREVEAIDAELNVRRAMGVGTDPLPELTEAPTQIAS